ncbi:hypothetical protein F511_26043 [Dorcoceras hygrometricum]|uniref:Uncharacterized protein n=1 Tax=Dorcoceras hygrometricum TaxID=472368 RepID=A0A2Z7CRC7_9LAMI|nr:hypothetical protein F511_26043 [Dorcoceras hygrometricum]
MATTHVRALVLPTRPTQRSTSSTIIKLNPTDAFQLSEGWELPTGAHGDTISQRDSRIREPTDISFYFQNSILAVNASSNSYIQKILPNTSTQSSWLNRLCAHCPASSRPTAQDSISRKKSQERQRKNKNFTGMRSIRVIKQIYVSTYIGCLASHLSGTCAWLQPVFQEPGASRLIAVDSSIRSTTRLEAPSSDCTRSPDEISTIGFSTSNWPEQISGEVAAAAAAHGGGGERREEGGGARFCVGLG